MILEPTREQLEFRRRAESFARQTVAPAAAGIDTQNAFPLALVTQAGAAGFVGMTISSRWGGGGRDYVSYVLAIEAIAAASATMAVIVTVNNSLVAETVERFGTDDQKKRWLPPLAAGSAVGAFALSEEEAGTDAANQRTRVAMDGFDYRLDGRKVWVANAEAADVAIVFAASQTGLGGRDITAYLVPMDTPGIARSPVVDAVGVRGLGCMDLEFRDVRLDVTHVLGAPGQGWRIARWALIGGRIAIAAQSLGLGQAALDEALAYARRRCTFGEPIASYQAIQWMLADTATELEAARMLTWKAADAKSRGEPCVLEASMAKLLASEAAHHATDKAMQVLASAAYRRGTTVERLARDARAARIYQGTSEVQRMIIAEHITG